MSRYLSISIHVGIGLLLWMPIIVTPGTFNPFLLGKALYAWGVIEVIVAMWAILALSDPTYRPPRSWVLAAFGGYVAVCFLSAVFGVNFSRSLWGDSLRFVGWWNMAHWFCFSVVAVSVIRPGKAWRSLLHWNLVVAFVISLIALAQVYGGVGTPADGRVHATIGNPSYLAAIIMVTTLTAAGFLASSFLSTIGPEHPTPVRRSSRPANRRVLGVEKNSWWSSLVSQLVLRRGFWAATAVLGLWVLVLTGTRGALIGLVGGAVAMPVTLAIFGNRKALRSAILAAAGVMAGLAVLFAVDQSPYVSLQPASPETTTFSRMMSTTGDESSLVIRLKLIEVAIRGFLDRPLLGWGPDLFPLVFDRFADASLYEYGTSHNDQPHNKVVEELATTGILGTTMYAALWTVLVWAIVRRRREPQEEIVAYAILGALFAYFIQNLFLFDTVVTLLQFTLLVSWVASQERAIPNDKNEHPTNQKKRGAPASTRLHAVPGVQITAILLVVALLGAALYFLNYLPYRSAQLFHQAFNEPGDLENRLTLAQESFETFPPFATVPRLLVLNLLNRRWFDLSPEERSLAIDFVFAEIDASLKSAPNNARLISEIVGILQRAAVDSPKGLQGLESLLQLSRSLAPERLSTYENLAFQELYKGNYREVLRIVEEFSVLATGAPNLLENAKRAAEEGLKKELSE